MGFGSTLLKILGAASRYSAVAAQAVQEAETQVGPGNGATKKQIATAYVLAGAHAGEIIGIPEVHAAAAAVELAFGIASMLGAFGSSKPGPATVAVPKILADSPPTPLAAKSGT